MINLIFRALSLKMSLKIFNYKIFNFSPCQNVIFISTLKNNHAHEFLMFLSSFKNNLCGIFINSQTF